MFPCPFCPDVHAATVTPNLIGRLIGAAYLTGLIGADLSFVDVEIAPRKVSTLEGAPHVTILTAGHEGRPLPHLADCWAARLPVTGPANRPRGGSL